MTQPLKGVYIYTHITSLHNVDCVYEMSKLNVNNTIVSLSDIRFISICRCYLLAWKKSTAIYLNNNINVDVQGLHKLYVTNLHYSVCDGLNQ